MRETSKDQVCQNPVLGYAKQCLFCLIYIHVHVYYSCAVTKNRGNRLNQVTIRMGACLCVHTCIYTYIIQFFCCGIVTILLWCCVYC